MKRATILSIVLLIFAVTTPAFAAGPTPGPNALKDTTWIGVLTFVNTDGETVEDNGTLTFTAESGNFLAGKLECKTSPCVFLPPDPGILFSCIRNGNDLQMTANGYSMSAAFFVTPAPKKANPPRKILTIQGSDISNGNMFQGALKKQ
jgi:hypothetical protein